MLVYYDIVQSGDNMGLNELLSIPAHKLNITEDESEHDGSTRCAMYSRRV